MFTGAKIKATHGKGADFYREHLANNDYYSEHDRVEGRWMGEFASAFGLSGQKVTPEAFSLFQQNLNPLTGEKLTPRNNPHSVRFYDFQCSAQKSVSVMSLFDSRLAEAHRKAVEVGMRELERFAAVRIRRGDNYATKNFAYTGKIVYAQYHHDNSRLLDPQLHTHNVIVNVTPDPNGSYKALDASEMYRTIRYSGKCYQNALARECLRLGYEIEMTRSDKGEITGFEIKGIPDELLKRCSRRREQIDREIEKFVASRGRQPTVEEVKRMTLQTRSRKMLEKTQNEVQEYKMSLFTDEEKAQLNRMAFDARSNYSMFQPRVNQEIAAKQIQYVAEQLFERHSVLRMDAILAEVQNQNLGRTSIEELQEAIKALPGLIDLGSPAVNAYYTTQENLERENYAVGTVNKTKGICHDFSSDYVPFSEAEDTFDHSAQKAVIDEIVHSKDPFVVFRGVAGAGKTSTLQELCKCLKKGGVENLHVVAPTNSAVDVLRMEKFSSAQTVAMFLQNRDKLPPDGSYLIIDESGLNSLKQGSEIIRLAMEHDYRVLFVGDERQHSSVEAGDFFRLLEQHSQITKTWLSEIHRQQTMEYRHGIELVASGSSKEGFEHLDANGFIHENQAKYLEKAAESFMRLTDGGKRPLDCIAACPTIRECEKLTDLIRQKMKDAGLIQNDSENVVESFRSWGWTKPQIGKIENYQVGTKIFFSTKVRGVGKAGEMAEVRKIEDGRLVLSNGVTVTPGSLKNSIDVGSSIPLPVGQGDIVRFTVNIRHPEYKINNGSLAIATGRPNEYLLLDSNRQELTTIQLPESFRGIKYGWVMTSHVSQGMTSKNVVVAAEKMSRQAFYVACSRGKFDLALHVPEKEYFKEKLLNIKTERLSVHDLIKSGEIAEPQFQTPSSIPPSVDGGGSEMEKSNVVQEKNPQPTAAEIKAQCDPDPGKLMESYRRRNLLATIRRIGAKTAKAVSRLIMHYTYGKLTGIIQKENQNVLQRRRDAERSKTAERRNEVSGRETRRTAGRVPEARRLRPGPAGGLGID